MRYSTIKRDSALLEGYRLERQKIQALDTAFAELKANGVLSKVEKNTTLGTRNKIDEVVYTLFPSYGFISEMKAANKRKILAEDTKKSPTDEISKS